MAKKIKKATKRSEVAKRQASSASRADRQLSEIMADGGDHHAFAKYLASIPNPPGMNQTDTLECFFQAVLMVGNAYGLSEKWRAKAFKDILKQCHLD